MPLNENTPSDGDDTETTSKKFAPIMTKSRPPKVHLRSLDGETPDHGVRDDPVTSNVPFMVEGVTERVTREHEGMTLGSKRSAVGPGRTGKTSVYKSAPSGVNAIASVRKLLDSVHAKVSGHNVSNMENSRMAKWPDTAPNITLKPTPDRESSTNIDINISTTDSVLSLGGADPDIVEKSGTHVARVPLSFGKRVLKMVGETTKIIAPDTTKEAHRR